MPGEIWRLPSYGKSAGTMQKNPLDDRALGLEWKAAKGESACSLFPISNRPSVVLTHPLSPSWFPEDIQRCKRIDAIVRFSFSLFFGGISCFVYSRITIAFRRLFAAAIKCLFLFWLLFESISINLNWQSYLKICLMSHNKTCLNKNFTIRTNKHAWICTQKLNGRIQFNCLVCKKM